MDAKKKKKLAASDGDGEVEMAVEEGGEEGEEEATVSIVRQYQCKSKINFVLKDRSFHIRVVNLVIQLFFIVFLCEHLVFLHGNLK